MFLYSAGPAVFVGGAGWRKAIRAWTWGMGIYVADLLYVSATHWHGRLLLPDPSFTFSVALFGLALCLVASAFPKWIMRVISAALLGLAMFWSSLAPDVWRDGAALLLVSERLPLYTTLVCFPVLWLLYRRWLRVG